MYYVALKIDNRKYHVAPLRPTDIASSTDALVPSFILDHQAGQECLLFSFIRQTKVICRGGYTLDRWIDWKSVSLEFTDAGLHLQMQTTDKQTPSQGTQPMPAMPTGFNLKATANRYKLLVTRHFTGTRLPITLSVIVDETVFQSHLLLHLVPQDSIYDVVMDFGSEASQIVTFRRGRHSLISRMKMVNNLLNYYYPDLKGKDLHQRVSDPELYRSAFFIKKEGALFDPTARPGLKGNDELLNLLTDKGEKNRLTAERVLVSNLKLAHLGAYNFTVQFASPDTNAFRVTQHEFSDTIVRLQQAVVNYFMQAVLEEIRRSTPVDKPLYVSVKLLVPNVFEQTKVAKLVFGTASGLAKIAQKHPDLQLMGNEVGTISESDSAFLGFKREQERNVGRGGISFFEPGGRYLIIDSGKGTTDYSILEINPITSQLVSLYRSGFIGAGNVLSYAFIDTVFTAICREDTEDRQRAIQAVTQRADVSNKLRFTEVIEKLKHDYNPLKAYQPLNKVVDFSIIRSQLFDENESGTLDTIAGLLEEVWKKQGSLLDEWQIINRTVNEVANRIHKEVVQSGRFANPETGEVLVKKIILTGRGFLFEPLRTAITKVFDSPTLKTDDPKKVCLSGGFSNDHINYESNLVGFPDVYQLFGRVGRQSKKIDTSDGVVIDIPVYNRLKSWVVTTGKPIGEALRNRTFAEGHLIRADTAIPTISPEQPTDMVKEEQFLNWGHTFEGFNRNTKVITICGLDYKQHQINSDTVNVFFTGDDFIIRDAHSYSRLQVEPEFFAQTQQVFQTLYPFADIQESAKVSVTPLTDSF